MNRGIPNRPRNASVGVPVGPHQIGGGAPIAVQSVPSPPDSLSETNGPSSRLSKFSAKKIPSSEMTLKEVLANWVYPSFSRKMAK